MPITINSDTSFLICDELGNVPAGTELGFYHEDIRFLSGYELTLDGAAPVLLAARPTDSNAATHFLTNPTLPAVPRGTLSLIRRRTMGLGLREEIAVTNHSERDVSLWLDLRIDADFAHTFDVKHEIEVSKERALREGDFSQERDEEGRVVRFRLARGITRRELVVRLSRRPDATNDTYRYVVALAPRECWRLDVEFLPLGALEREGTQAPPGEKREAVRERQRLRTELVARSPALSTDSYILRRAYEQSVRDFAALRMGAAEGEFVIAAGIPWFMTLFGRDSLIAAYQALPFYPEAAKGVLRALARLQGTRVDRARAEEPGKILHERRNAAYAGLDQHSMLFPYYGTVDATPLFLLLLAAVWRITGDLDFVRALRPHALRALDWMDRFGDRDGDGYLEYVRENELGLENQGWKDSGDAIRHADGRLAQAPIALCEVQGYAYAARIGMAEAFAALGEPERAAALRADAARLREHFNRDFWMPDRGYYALALDGKKQPVDSITSNAGHLLWAGIADKDKARLVARRLVSPALFSGWGIRTLAATEAGFNPISYHNGSVWPHDNSLIVAGMARYGLVAEAATVADGLLSALAHYPDARLPELFAGYSRADAPFPVEYPTASRPQAWAAGSIFLILAAMAGIDALAPKTKARPFLPQGMRRLRLEGVWGDRQRTDVEVVRRGARVVARMASAPARPGAA